MKKIINKVQTTFKALQLLSEPDVLNRLYTEANSKKRIVNSDNSKAKFIFHKHFIVQVMN